MSNRNFLRKLEFMKGKTFQYANKIHYIKDYSIDEAREEVKITTNLDNYKRSYDSIDEFLTYWEEVKQVATAIEPANQMVVFMEAGTNLADDMINILKDNIEKVKANKEYIPQAQAINNNVNSIINLTKLKLDVVKQMRGRKGA